MGRVVIVGGSVEAWDLAQAVPGAHVVLPGAERVARDWPGAVTSGLPARFEPDDLVVEAAHPCDAATALAVAARVYGRHLQLVRPAWRPGPRDRWRMVRDMRAARAALPAGARVLVTTGRADLVALRGVRARLLVRQLGAGPMPLGRALLGVGPFDAAQELQLLRRERIDMILTRNAGGAGGWPKLEAARRLGLPVVMVARPARPLGARVAHVEEALAWLQRNG